MSPETDKLRRMIEIRFHGRGGQGAVIGGKILAIASYQEGMFVQAFPAFGVERRGAPVAAFVRLDKKRIDLRTQVYTPDHLIILDPTLMNNPATFTGLKPGGWVLINTTRPPEDLSKHPKLTNNRVATVGASHIAAKLGLGSPTSPIVNTAILGAFARVTNICSIDAVCQAIRKGVPIKPEENATAATEAFNEVRFEN